MRRVINTILAIILVLTVASVAFKPVPVHAGFVDLICLFNPSVCTEKGFSVGSAINGTVAWVGNLILTASAYILALSGTVLNISITLTMNIKAIYEATPAIDRVWLLIRNLSSMFIIFALIYTSILTILNTAKTSASTLIKNIIMAGILINFSLFFTKTLIDASNLISLQFYRALVPNSATISKDSIVNVISNTYAKGGLSDVFMQSLKIPSVYDNPKGLITGVPENDFFNIIIGTFGGALLMLMAAGSFFAASIAFIIRIVILLLLMGFSPIYFVGMIFPQIKGSVSNKWEGWLIGQLVFMPVYLLLMYISVSFLTGIGDQGFFSQLDAARTNRGSTNNVLFSTVGLLLQYTIAYILLLVPLMGAVQFGGKSMTWGQSAQKWVSGKLWGAGGAVGGVIGRNTVGSAARGAGKAFDSMAASAQESESGRRVSSALRNLGISQFTRGKIDKYEKGKYGSNKSLADVEKEDKDRSRVIAGVQRFKGQMASINSVLNTTAPPSATELKSFRDTLGKMGVKEFEKIDLKMLTNPVFAANLTSAQADKISESDFLTEAQKEQFKDTRKTQLNDVLEKGDPNTIKEHMKGLSGKELMKMKLDIFNNSSVIDNITATQLKDMSDLDGNTKVEIGGYILNLGKAGSSHKALGYIRSNKDEWTK